MIARPLDAAFYERVLLTINAARLANPGLPDIVRGGNSVRHIAIKALADESGEPATTWDKRFRRAAIERPFAYAAAFEGKYDPENPEREVPKVEPQAEAPVAAPVTKSAADEAREHNAKLDAAATRAKLKSAYTEIARLEARVRDFEWASGINLEPPEWAISSSPKSKTEHIPILTTSDFQVGEVIRPEEIDLAHGYDVETFRRRYRLLIEKTIQLCLVHQPSWTYPGIIYERLGDTISGGIHEDLETTDEATPIDSVIIAAEEEAAGIEKLVEAFGRVWVQEAGGGNHDRDTHKPRSKNATGHSFDKLVSHILQLKFRGDPRVTFHTTKSPDIVYQVYERTILSTHGDKIGSRGGQGYIGPVATMARGAQKVITEQMALGRRIDEVRMGHFHTYVDLGWLLGNGCLPGYSEFAKMNRMRPEPPMQLLSFMAPKHGRVCTRRIFLEAPRPGIDASWCSDAA